MSLACCTRFAAMILRLVSADSCWISIIVFRLSASTSGFVDRKTRLLSSTVWGRDKSASCGKVNATFGLLGWMGRSPCGEGRVSGSEVALLRKNLLILAMSFLCGLWIGDGPVACSAGATRLCLDNMQPILTAVLKYVSNSFLSVYINVFNELDYDVYRATSVTSRSKNDQVPRPTRWIPCNSIPIVPQGSIFGLIRYKNKDKSKVVSKFQIYLLSITFHCVTCIQMRQNCGWTT